MVFCRHKERATWEIPGGHREPDESIEDAARRELWEETGAEPFEIQPVSVYQVTKDKDASYGMLYFAKISRLGALPPHSEMEEIRLFDCLPKELTYPNIQAQLYNYIQNWLNLQSSPG